MPKIDKNKKKIVVLPKQKPKLKKKIAKPAQVKTLTKSVPKPRSVRSKENTLAYYDCLLEQIANNDKVKITKLCSWCRDNKGKVAWGKAEGKKSLVEKVAKGYLEFGKGLGHLLHADIVGCNCKE